MKLYLIRHGIAETREQNADDLHRPLTKEGKEQVRAIAKRLRDMNMEWEMLLTSPLVRATQTSQILFDEGLALKTATVNYLRSPESDFSAFVRFLEESREAGVGTLAMVGHAPTLAHWAETLMCGKELGTLQQKKAGIIGLDISDTGTPVGNAQLFWLTAPKLLLQK